MTRVGLDWSAEPPRPRTSREMVVELISASPGEWFRINGLTKQAVHIWTDTNPEIVYRAVKRGSTTSLYVQWVPIPDDAVCARCARPFMRNERGWHQTTRQPGTMWCPQCRKGKKK